MTVAGRGGLVLAIDPGSHADEWEDVAQRAGLVVRPVGDSGALEALHDDWDPPDVAVLDGTRPDLPEILRALYFADRCVERVLVAPQLDWQALRWIWTYGQCFTIVDPADLGSLPLAEAVASSRAKRRAMPWRRWVPVLPDCTRSERMRAVHAELERAVEDRSLVVLRGPVASGRASLARTAVLLRGIDEGLVQEYVGDPLATVQFDEEAGLGGEVPIVRDLDRWTADQRVLALEVLEQRGDRGPWFVTVGNDSDLTIAGARVIDVPGLAERPEDVGELLQHFLVEASYRHGRDGVHASSEAMAEAARHRFGDGGLGALAEWAEAAVLSRPERGRHEIQSLRGLA